MPQGKLTFFQHIEELRKVVLKSLIFFIIACLISYRFTPLILPHLVRPVGKLIFIAPTEAFLTYISIAIFLGLFLSSPFIIYQIWKFVACGLRKKEKRLVSLFAILSFILFIFGCLFGYFLILPLGIKFLLQFSTIYIRPMITISNYVSFAGTLAFIFGMIMQLPLIMLFLTKTGIVDLETLTKRRKEVIVLIFIVAAFLTPPDIITQILLSLPLLVLYEVGIVFSKVALKRS